MGMRRVRTHDKNLSFSFKRGMDIYSFFTRGCMCDKIRSFATWDERVTFSYYFTRSRYKNHRKRQTKYSFLFPIQIFDVLEFNRSKCNVLHLCYTY